MPDRPLSPFGALLRQLRIEAGLSQEDLALAAGLHPRAVSDLERGLVGRPRKNTVRALADALGLAGKARADFETAALGRPRALGGDPQSWLSRVVKALDDLGAASARSVVAQWRASAPVEEAWPDWAEDLIRLTAAGRMQPAADRPLPVVGPDPHIGRDEQKAELSAFLDRVKGGRGGLAVIIGPAGIGKSHLLGRCLADLSDGIGVEWVTFDRDEAGYRGWRRLLAPLWIAIRRTELPPIALLAHAGILDDILLVGGDGTPARHFPGAVAAAIAGLLDHIAARGPLVVVIDDAHFGGATSDQLMLDVARLLSACAVGIVAALRLDEVEDTSPIRSYGDQAQDRAARDVVVPIRVPPFDAKATARLLLRLTGSEPPPGVIDEVIRQTAGRPQLMKYTVVQARTDGDQKRGWTVGKLGADGLRVLESTIHSRPDRVRDVLYAAAVCAHGGYVIPGFLARVTELPVDEVERILDDERRRDSMLTPHIPGYHFQHDNWIDALTDLCAPPRLRALHARCLELLREDRVPDPRRLAWHANGAGAELVGEEMLAGLSKKAADLSFADYAFGRAAELYAIAAQCSAGTDHIDLLIGEADALRFSGAWDQAREALRTALSLARDLDVPGHEAKALIHLERLTWTYGLDEKQMTQQLRDVLDRLPPGDAELRAPTQAALAQRLSIAAREYDDEQADFARSALRELPAVSDPLARADCLLGIRGGLQDNVAPEELLGYAEQVVNLGIKLNSVYHLNEALSARIVDLIRCGRPADLPAAVREYRLFAEQSGAPVTVYGHVLFDGMFALARGDSAAARECTTRAGDLSGAWGESMAGEALMAQAGWLLYETGELTGLAEFLVSLPSRDVSTLNGPLWSLGAGLIHAEQGDVKPAIHRLMQVCASTGDLAKLPRGPSRISILATATMVLGHPLVIDALPVGEASRIGSTLAQLLTDHRDVLVLAGWPAVILGSKHRYIGLAQLAAGDTAAAAEHLFQAVEENEDLGFLHARTIFDLARALLRQPATHAAGVTEMERARQLAKVLQMRALEAQAVDGLARID